MKRKFAPIIVIMSAIILLTGCTKDTLKEQPDVNSNTSVTTTPELTTEEKDSAPGHTIEVVPDNIPLTKIQEQPDNYVSIDEVGTYNEAIITDELIASCTLPETKKEALPYWTGTIFENKISVNYGDDRWNDYREADKGAYYFLEEEVKYLSDNGFNCARVLLSFSFLSNPDDINSINVAELEQLDELISWGLKYNVHIMISITGLPGKNNTSWEEEGLQSNSSLFTDSEMTEAFQKYWDVLAKRYSNIPAKALSFELAAESSVPDGDLDLYTSVLGPIAQNIWTYNKDRILIVNDVYHDVPEELAAMGCCLSLHNHIYTVDSRRLADLGVTYNPTWPMQYLPEFYFKESGPLSLISDEGFAQGELLLYYEGCGFTFNITEDDALVSSSEYYEVTDSLYESSIEISAGTKNLVLTPKDGGQLLAITIKQEGRDDITIPTHALYSGIYDQDRMPAIAVHTDGTLENIDSPQKLLNADYLEAAYLKKFMDCANNNGVSFLMTEIGTDTFDLSPEEYVAYHSTWLDALSKNHISWMYNCTHNILAPSDIMSLNYTNSEFTDFSAVPGIPGYNVNNVVMDMLKKYE